MLFRSDELFAAAPAERDAGARQEMYEEALRIVIDEDAAYATIVNQALCHAYSKTLDMEAGLANMYVSPNPYDICFK